MMNILRNENGNIFFTALAAIGAVGAIAASTMSIISGPVKTLNDVNKFNYTEMRAEIAGRLMMDNASTTDCDTDGIVEPIAYRDASGAVAPTGGGLLPTSVGLNVTTDSWGSELGYCVWDHGDSACAGNRLRGDTAASPDATLATIAVISPGPDRTSETTCQSFDDADANDDGDLADASDGKLVAFTKGSDDIVEIYTYAKSQELGGDVWTLSDSDTAGINKNIAIGGDTSVAGIIDFSAGAGANLILPTETEFSLCTGDNEGELRVNTTTSPSTLEICTSSAFESVSGGDGGGGVEESTVTNDFDSSALETDSYVAYAWGRETSGNHGNGSLTADQESPVRLDTTYDFVQGSISGSHGCGVKANGTVWCWGNDGSGSVGDGAGNSGTVESPAQVEGLTNMVHVAVGSLTSCAVSATGAGYCWGGYNPGKLGTDDVASNQYTPVQVENVTDFVTIDGAQNHFCGLRAEGTIYCWGEGDAGELGDGNSVDSPLPVQAGSYTDFIDVAVGNQFSCGVRENGDAYCWGDDDEGELGNGAGVTAEQPSPYPVSGGYKFVSIDAGEDTACALTAEGAAYCWGDDFYGILGGVGDSTEPVEYTHLYDIVQLRVGFAGACAIISDGTGYCWGRDGDGEIGNGSGITGNKSEASPIDTTEKFTYIYSGYLSAFGIIRSTKDGDSVAPESPYTITQLQGAGDRLDSYGLKLEQDSTTTDDTVALAFKNDETQIDGTEEPSAAITVYRKDSDGAGGFSFSTLDSGDTLAQRLWLDPLGALKLDATTTDAYAALQLDEHDAAAWDSDYYNGLLVTTTGVSSDDPVFLGLDNTNGYATIMSVNDIVIENSDNTANTVDTVMSLTSSTTTFSGDLNAASALPTIEHSSYSDTANNAPSFIINRYRGTSGSPLTVADGDTAGSILFRAHDGASLGSASAAIYAEVNGTVSTGEVPMDLVFGMDSTEDALNSSNEAMRLTNDGNLGLGENAPAYKLDVAGRGGASGGVRIGIDSSECSGSNEGTMRFNFESGYDFEYCDSNDWLGVVDPYGIPIYDLATGVDHSCAVLANGQAVCWGDNTNDELANGSSNDPETDLIPIPTSTANTVIDVAATGDSTCVLYEAGNIQCVGSTTNGLGDGSSTVSSTFVDVSGISTAVQIDAGQAHFCALLSDGTVECWGQGFRGQMGDGSGGSNTTPNAVTGVSNAVLVVSGYWHNCVLLADRTAQCWGTGGDGRLGDGGTSVQYTPVDVQTLTDIVDIALAYTHSCAIESDGDLFCWGTVGSDNGPTAVAGVSNVVDIAVTYSGGVCALIRDGTVYCKGGSFPGSFTQIDNDGDIVKFSSGHYLHFCGVTTSGGAKCLGFGNKGQLGDGETVNIYDEFQDVLWP